MSIISITFSLMRIKLESAGCPNLAVDTGLCGIKMVFIDITPIRA
jgi:hypothetical protein